MLNLKQITVIAVMGAAFLCSSTSMAATKECTKNQYLVGSTCTACPKNATCNGKKATCNAGYPGDVVEGKTSCHCPDGQYLLKDKTTCKKKPANGSANGKKAKCNDTFQIKTATDGTVTCSCKSGQYIAKGVCKNKPANGTADGKNAECNKTFTATPNPTTGEITCACMSNQILKDGKCTKCPGNATCTDGKTFTCNAGFALESGVCKQTCASNQYRLADGTCKACPANATCNGKKATCNKDYITRTASDGSGKMTCGCEKGEYVVGKECKPCPKDSTIEKCSGVHVVCKGSLQRIKNSDGTEKCGCAANEYMVGTECKACPTATGATCNGTKTITCPAGKKVIDGTAKGTKVCGCDSGKYWNDKDMQCQQCPSECTAKK